MTPAMLREAIPSAPRGVAGRRPRFERELPLHIGAATFMRYALPPEVLWSHFPAGEKRDIRAAAKLKAMGLARGWADFVLVFPVGQAAFLELKSSTGSLSTDQASFRDAAIAVGAWWATCRSLDRVEEVLTSWAKVSGVALHARTVERVT